MSIKYFTILFFISFISFTMGLVWVTSPRDSWIGDNPNANMVTQKARDSRNENDVKLMTYYLERDSLEQRKKDSILVTNRTNP